MIVVYKDEIDDKLTFVGVYLNAHHIEKHLGIPNANVGKYLKKQISTLQGYIAVSVDFADQPVTKEYAERKTWQIAKYRQQLMSVVKLGEKELSKLTADQVRRIKAILDEGKL